MKRTAALALAADLLIGSADPARDAAALLARWAALRTPTRGAHVAAPGALAALLDAAPVWLLGPGREHWEALQGMGLHTQADLRALPRSGLARRFGEALLDDLDRAYGRRPDPRRWLELPERFEGRLELFARAGAFTLSMRHEPRHGAAVPATELRVELAEPALDPAHLQLLLPERLARATLAAPTLELDLRCRHLMAGAPPNGGLFPTRHTKHEGLLERLRARLGDAQVQCLEPVADHRPERACRLRPARPRSTVTIASRLTWPRNTGVSALASRRSAASVSASGRKSVPSAPRPCSTTIVAAAADAAVQLEGFGRHHRG